MRSGRARPVDDATSASDISRWCWSNAPEHVEAARERLDEVRSRASSCHGRRSPQPSESEPGSPNIVPRAPWVLSDW